MCVIFIFAAHIRRRCFGWVSAKPFTLFMAVNAASEGALGAMDRRVWVCIYMPGSIVILLQQAVWYPLSSSSMMSTSRTLSLVLSPMLSVHDKLEPIPFTKLLKLARTRARLFYALETRQHKHFTIVGIDSTTL